MAKHALPVFTRDLRTGAMKELTPGEAMNFARIRDTTAPLQFRVLVADDMELDRRLTIRLLGKAWLVERDLTVECAADGTEALEKIHRHRYALVVLDWNMAQPDGAEVLRAIREKGLRVPVVVVSGERRETIARDLETMAATFVSKDDLNPGNFHDAIAMSIQLQERQGPIGSEPDTRQV